MLNELNLENWVFAIYDKNLYFPNHWAQWRTTVSAWETFPVNVMKWSCSEGVKG